MSIISYFKKRREQKRRLRQLGEIGGVFHSLDQCEEGGLVAFDKKNRRLFIEEPLAVVMMSGGAEKWQAFMHNCFTWLYYRQCSEAWEAFIRKEELAAVRKATKQYAAMTRADIERVRRARRTEIGESDMEPPKVEPFEFFVVREKMKDEEGADDGAAMASQQTEQEKTEGAKRAAVPGGEILAVGSYEPETERLEMAAWEDVAVFLRKEEE